MFTTRAVSKSKLLLATLLVVFFAHAGGAEDKLDDASELAASLLEGAIHNNRGLVSFDVGISSEKTVMRPDGSIRVSETTSRYVQDDTGRQLIAHWKVFDRLNKDAAENPQATLTAVYYEGDKQPVVLLNDFGRRRMPIDSLDRFRMVSEAPRFSTVGFVGFPHFNSAMNENDLYWQSLTIPSQHITAKSQNDHIATVTSVLSRDGREYRRIVWKFDLTRMVPKDRKIYYTHTVSQKRLLKESEQYRWKMASGVNVPISLIREVRQIATEKETGKQVPYSEFSDTTLSWTKVNESIGDLNLILNSFKSPQAIREWVQQKAPQERR